LCIVLPTSSFYINVECIQIVVGYQSYFVWTIEMSRNTFFKFCYETKLSLKHPSCIFTKYFNFTSCHRRNYFITNLRLVEPHSISIFSVWGWGIFNFHYYYKIKVRFIQELWFLIICVITFPPVSS